MRSQRRDRLEKSLMSDDFYFNCLWLSSSEDRTGEEPGMLSLSKGYVTDSFIAPHITALLPPGLANTVGLSQLWQWCLVKRITMWQARLRLRLWWGLYWGSAKVAQPWWLTRPWHQVEEGHVEALKGGQSSDKSLLGTCALYRPWHQFMYFRVLSSYKTLLFFVNFQRVAMTAACSAKNVWDSEKFYLLPGTRGHLC
jgi:hypothetical protein